MGYPIAPPFEYLRSIHPLIHRSSRIPIRPSVRLPVLPVSTETVSVPRSRCCPYGCPSPPSRRRGKERRKARSPSREGRRRKGMPYSIFQARMKRSHGTYSSIARDSSPDGIPFPECPEGKLIGGHHAQFTLPPSPTSKNT